MTRYLAGGGMLLSPLGDLSHTSILYYYGIIVLLCYMNTRYSQIAKTKSKSYENVERIMAKYIGDGYVLY
jgi:hypothetical protein